MEYLLHKMKANIDTYNYRGWSPFQATRNPEIYKLEKPIRQELNKGDSLLKSQKEFYMESSEYISKYQYCIITNEKDDIKYNIVYDQLLNV